MVNICMGLQNLSRNFFSKMSIVGVFLSVGTNEILFSHGLWAGLFTNRLRVHPHLDYPHLDGLHLDLDYPHLH